MSDRYEEKIDAALKVLRGTRAPEGMEERLLAAVRMQEVAVASSQDASPAAGWFGGRAGWVWSGVAAAVVLVGVLAVSRWEVPSAARHSVADGVARHGLVVGVDTRGVVPVKHDTEHRVASAALAVRVRRERSSAQAPQEVARSDADLPSFPAPPAPLTQEEQLLLRIARSGDRVELAMLDPAIRNARVEDEKVEVRKFFGEVTEKEVTEKEATEKEVKE